MVIEKKNLDGTIDYIFSLDQPILYNDTPIYLTGKKIPIKEQFFFNLPEEKNYYAIINVYYSIENNIFIYDVVKKTPFYIDNYDSKALPNYIPVAQFIIQQFLNSFEVKKINQVSDLSTFVITTIFNNGDIGNKGDIGYTGIMGETGLQGDTGYIGPQGYTGLQGDTGVGYQGYTGLQGETGIYPDLDLLLYLKFKNFDDSLLDYSPYERDFIWYETGACFTGIAFYEDGSTGIEIIPTNSSNYTVVEGIKDNAHKTTYFEGNSGYKNNKFIGFSGIIQAWIKISTEPIPDFIYEYIFYTGMLYYPVKFINTSLYADEVIWNIENKIYKAGVIEHTFGSTGIYLVKISAKNKNGESYKSDLIQI
jgi:hypothetical protein